MRVPKIISFIWAGGPRPLPLDNHKVIEGWKKENSDFQMILWVSLPLPKNVALEYDRRKYTLASSNPKDSKDPNYIENIIGKTNADPDSPIIIADINTLFDRAAQYFSPKSRLNKLKDIINYEIINFTPNYGASSDLWRYLLLLAYGGVFSDSDVPCLGKLNEESPYKDSSTDTAYFMVPEHSQGYFIIGNDVIVCSPGNQITKALIFKCLDNYCYKYYETIDLSLYEAFDHRFSTVRRTGPEMLRGVLQEFKIIEGEKPGNVLSSSNRLFPNSKPLEKTGGDFELDGAPTQCETMEKAVRKAQFSMTQEAIYMGVCRFSDHVYHIGRSLKQPLLTALSNYLLKNKSYCEFLNSFIAKNSNGTAEENFDFYRILINLESLFYGLFNINLNSAVSRRIMVKLFKKVPRSINHLKATPSIVIRDNYFATILIEENLFSCFVGSDDKIPGDVIDTYRQVCQSTSRLLDRTISPGQEDKVTWSQVYDFMEKTIPYDINNQFNSAIAEELISGLLRIQFFSLLKLNIKHGLNDKQFPSWAEKVNKSQESVEQKISLVPPKTLSSEQQELPTISTPPPKTPTQAHQVQLFKNPTSSKNQTPRSRDEVTCQLCIIC